MFHQATNMIYRSVAVEHKPRTLTYMIDRVPIYHLIWIPGGCLDSRLFVSILMCLIHAIWGNLAFVCCCPFTSYSCWFLHCLSGLCLLMWPWLKQQNSSVMSSVTRRGHPHWVSEWNRNPFCHKYRLTHIENSTSHAHTVHVRGRTASAPNTVH